MAKRSLSVSLLWDQFGMGVSGICALHCLFFPVIISILPLWQAGESIHEWTHPLFILLLLPVVYFAVRRSHYNFKITLLLISGLVLIILGWLIGHFWLGEFVETVLTLSGSLILIAGHWFNYRHHRICTNSRHRHHPELHGTGGKVIDDSGIEKRSKQVKRSKQLKQSKQVKQHEE